MDERVVWTDLSHQEIQQLLGETYEVWVSKPIIKKLLKKHGYRRRQAQKNAR